MQRLSHCFDWGEWGRGRPISFEISLISKEIRNTLPQFKHQFYYWLLAMHITTTAWCFCDDLVMVLPNKFSFFRVVHLW